MCTQSIDKFHVGDDFHTALANEFYAASENRARLSNETYEASWDACYGPVNSEGYTAYDASVGYTPRPTRASWNPHRAPAAAR